jgi:hypothetical protein
MTHLFSVACSSAHAVLASALLTSTRLYSILYIYTKVDAMRILYPNLCDEDLLDRLAEGTKLFIQCIDQAAIVLSIPLCSDCSLQVQDCTNNI